MNEKFNVIKIKARWHVMKKSYALIAVGLALGIVFQSYTDWVPTKVLKPEVYSKPISFEVSRSGNIIRHKAVGVRALECRIVSPITADLKDSTNTIRTRELVRYFSQANDLIKLAELNPDLVEKISKEDIFYEDGKTYTNVDNITDQIPIDYLKPKNTSVIAFNDIPAYPRQFEANQFIIVSSDKDLELSDRFTIQVDCVNPVHGRMIGEFGPFPIPADGKTLTENSPESELPISLPIKTMLLQGGIIALILLLVLV